MFAVPSYLIEGGLRGFPVGFPGGLGTPPAGTGERIDLLPGLAWPTGPALPTEGVAKEPLAPPATPALAPLVLCEPAVPANAPPTLLLANLAGLPLAGEPLPLPARAPLVEAPIGASPCLKLPECRNGVPTIEPMPMAPTLALASGNPERPKLRSGSLAEKGHPQMLRMPG